jgi:hypothetical protein
MLYSLNTATLAGWAIPQPARSWFGKAEVARSTNPSQKQLGFGPPMTIIWERGLGASPVY